MVGFRGSTQEKSPSEIFRFGYKKAANDKMVPDPVGSGPNSSSRNNRRSRLYDSLCEAQVKSMVVFHCAFSDARRSIAKR